MPRPGSSALRSMSEMRSGAGPSQRRSMAIAVAAPAKPAPTIATRNMARAYGLGGHDCHRRLGRGDPEGEGLLEVEVHRVGVVMVVADRHVLARLEQEVAAA